jgi:hypothetical protein
VTFDWEEWRARTGGVDGRSALDDQAAVDVLALGNPAERPAEAVEPDRSGRAFETAPDGGRPGRTGVVVLTIAAVCALLGGIAAFAATLGGATPGPAAAVSIAPEGMTGTIAPTGTGLDGDGPHHPGSGGADHGRADPSLSPLPEPTGTGQPAAGAGHADPFSPAVSSYLASRAGTVLAGIEDLRTGQTWTLGGGRPQATGSIVKVDILQTLLARHPSGLSTADRRLARAMIENSSNGAATVLWEQVGRAAGLSTYNGSVGLQQTTPSTCLVCAGFGWPGWGLTTTTPADQLLLLRQLVDGTQLSPANRGYAVSLMQNVEPDQRWGVSGGVPSGVAVALKNAWVPLTPPDTDWQINSEGWISGDGRDYLIAVLTTGNPDEQYGIDTINTLSAMLWKAMG